MIFYFSLCILLEGNETTNIVYMKFDTAASYKPIVYLSQCQRIVLSVFITRLLGCHFCHWYLSFFF
jgi:hypothetical protein